MTGEPLSLTLKVELNSWAEYEALIHQLKGIGFSFTHTLKTSEFYFIDAEQGGE